VDITGVSIDDQSFFDGASNLHTIRWNRSYPPKLSLPGEDRCICAIAQTPLRHNKYLDAYLVGIRLDDGTVHIQCRSFVGSEERFRRYIATEIPLSFQKTHGLSLEYLLKELERFAS
jgi:hypothetical protein